MNLSRNLRKHKFLLVSLIIGVTSSLSAQTQSVDDLLNDLSPPKPAAVQGPGVAPAPATKTAPAPVNGVVPSTAVAPEAKKLTTEKPEGVALVVPSVPTLNMTDAPPSLSVAPVAAPVSKEKATGDLISWAEYVSTDKKAPVTGANWNVGLLVDTPWYSDVKLDDKAQALKLRAELVKRYGLPSTKFGVEQWNDTFYSYAIGLAPSLVDLYNSKLSVNEERSGKVATYKDGWVLRVVNLDTEKNILVVNRINTPRISNSGMAVKAAAAPKGATPKAVAAGAVKSVKDAANGMTGGAYTGCPPGKVWQGPYTNDKGQLIPGRCVDQPKAATPPPAAPAKAPAAKAPATPAKK